jgi:hypothetical protein
MLTFAKRLRQRLKLFAMANFAKAFFVGTFHQGDSSRAPANRGPREGKG